MKNINFDLREGGAFQFSRRYVKTRRLILKVALRK